VVSSQHTLAIAATNKLLTQNLVGRASEWAYDDHYEILAFFQFKAHVKINDLLLFAFLFTISLQLLFAQYLIIVGMEKRNWGEIG
jgi:hypothetical protein